MPAAPDLPTPNTKRIGEALREWMHVRRLNQSQAAQVLHVSQATVSRALHGLVAEESSSLNKICTGSGVDPRPPALWQGGVVPEPPLPTAFTSALRRLWDGTPADADRVTHLLDAVATLRGSTSTAAEER